MFLERKAIFLLNGQRNNSVIYLCSLCVTRLEIGVRKLTHFNCLEGFLKHIHKYILHSFLFMARTTYGRGRAKSFKTLNTILHTAKQTIFTIYANKKVTLNFLINFHVITYQKELKY